MAILGEIDVNDWDSEKTWYHGSPLELTTIREGSTITQNVDLARAFSHKPNFVTINVSDEIINIKHSGKIQGFLYRIEEELSSDDIYPHPDSSMEYGFEWLTKRELHITLIGDAEILDGEMLSEEEVAELKKHYEKNG